MNTLTSCTTTLAHPTLDEFHSLTEEVKKGRVIIVASSNRYVVHFGNISSLRLNTLALVQDNIGISCTATRTLVSYKEVATVDDIAIPLTNTKMVALLLDMQARGILEINNKNAGLTHTTTP